MIKIVGVYHVNVILVYVNINHALFNSMQNVQCYEK